MRGSEPGRCKHVCWNGEGLNTFEADLLVLIKVQKIFRRMLDEASKAAARLRVGKGEKVVKKRTKNNKRAVYKHINQKANQNFWRQRW